MSTYTDLHMRRRENLTILRKPGAPDDGITPQRVIFANPENIYEGTFKGRFEAKGVSFTSVDLTDVTINGGKIIDTEIYSDGRFISMADLTANVSEAQEAISDLQDFQESTETSCATFAWNISFLSDHLSTLELSANWLSGYADDLSNAVDAISNYSGGISSYLSNAVCTLMSADIDLSTSLSSLSTQTNARIEDLKTQVKGGLVYKGLLKIDDFAQEGDHSISGLFMYSGWNDEDRLSTGYMCMASAPNHKENKYSFGGVELEHGDWLIVKENCFVSSVTSVDVDVFDAQDYDNFKLSDDNVVKGNNAFNGETTFNGNVKFNDSIDIDAQLSLSQKVDFLDDVNVKGQLSTSSFVANDANIKNLSINLDAVTYENGLCSLQDLSNDIYGHLSIHSSGIDEINDRLLSVDDKLVLHDIKLSNHMQYHGAFTEYEVTTEQLSSRYLSVFLDHNLNLKFEETIQLGFMAKFISSMTLIDSNNISVNFYNNDYIICNKDVVLSNAQLSDFDVIRDAQVEVENAICAEISARISNDNVISGWLLSNFANTGDNTYSSTTTLKQEVSVDNALTVASNAYVLSDLSVSGQLFVNGAQLGITTEPGDPGSGVKTVAQTVADEISFVAKDKDSSSDAAPSISITKTSITFNAAPVYVDATSSFIISADSTKVIDASSSQVEILSVLSVETDKATITTLSTGILSVDFAHLVDSNSMSSMQDISSELENNMLSNDSILSNAIDRKIFIDGLSTESLSAIHISQDDFYQKVVNDQILSNELYIVSSEYVDAYGEQIKNVATPTDLSDATTKEYVDDNLSLKQDISALPSDVSSIVLSSVGEWVITNQTDWSFDVQPYYIGNNKWKANFQRGGDFGVCYADGDENATSLHFDDEIEIDVWAEKRNVNVLGLVTYDYLTDELTSKADITSLTAYEQTSSLYNDVSSIVLENDDSLYLSSEYGSLNVISIGNSMITFSGEIAGFEFSFYQTGGVDWDWSWLIDSGHVSDFDINVDTSVTINIAGANLATQLGTDSIIFIKVQESKNKLGLVTYDYLSNELSILEDQMLSNDSILSTSIDRKIFIDGLSVESLSAIHISQADFYQKVINDQILSNELYIVSGDYINAYGQNIKNLAKPLLSDDAATKGYVDDANVIISSNFTDLISSIYDGLSAIEVDETLSCLNQKSCISSVISAVVGIRDTLALLRQTMATILSI